VGPLPLQGVLVKLAQVVLREQTAALVVERAAAVAALQLRQAVLGVAAVVVGPVAVLVSKACSQVRHLSVSPKAVTVARCQAEALVALGAWGYWAWA